MSDLKSDRTGSADFKKSRRIKPEAAEKLHLDRLPPHSIEAEQGVLGCALLSPNECMGECIEKLKDGGMEVFYDLRHQTIYEILAAMYDQRQAIDIITLQQKLKDKALLDQIGGISYLSQLQDAVPSAANLSYYLEIVLEKFLLRRMIRVCTEATGKVYDFEGEVDALLDEVERDVLKIAESRSQTGTAPVKELVGRAIQQVENYFSRKGVLNGIGTGFAGDAQRPLARG